MDPSPSTIYRWIPADHDGVTNMELGRKAENQLFFSGESLSGSTQKQSSLASQFIEPVTLKGSVAFHSI